MADKPKATPKTPEQIEQTPVAYLSTDELIAHLAARCVVLALGYTPSTDPESMYTKFKGEHAEAESMARDLVHEAVDRGLPKTRRRD